LRAFFYDAGGEVKEKARRSGPEELTGAQTSCALSKRENDPQGVADEQAVSPQAGPSTR
jgi:hypothetical protein